MAQTKARKTKTKYKTPKPKAVVVKEQAAQYSVSPRLIIETDHPHIIRIEGVRGGRPIIRDVYVSVQAIVELVYRLKQTPDEIIKDGFAPHLSLAHIYDALSYYHDHKREIDDSIKANDRAGERALKLSRKLAKEYKERQKIKSNGDSKNGKRH
jgi:uncharacterized protein (DUF433 family)